jgi:microcystin-dependent protein
MPAGAMMPYAGSAAPSGWLLCYGQAVSRATYAALWAALGTTYGSGDGSTTFNLPDLRGRVAAGVDNMGGSAANRITSGGSGITGTTLGASGGAETHTLTTAQIPSHTHGAGSYMVQVCDGSGGGSGYPRNLYSGVAITLPVTGTSGSSGSGNAHQNAQPTIMLNYIIKT